MFLTQASIGSHASIKGFLILSTGVHEGQGYVLQRTRTSLPEVTNPTREGNHSNLERLAKNQKKRLPSWPGERKFGFIKNRQSVWNSSREYWGWGEGRGPDCPPVSTGPSTARMCARIPLGTWSSAHSVPSLHCILWQHWKSGWLGFLALSHHCSSSDTRSHSEPLGKASEGGGALFTMAPAKLLT